MEAFLDRYVQLLDDNETQLERKEYKKEGLRTDFKSQSIS